MLVDSFLEYLRAERAFSPKTVLNYGSDLSQFEVFYKAIDEELTWKTVDADLARQWVMTLMEKSYTATSVNRKLSALRAFYRYLKICGEVEKNPMAKVVGPKKRKPLPSFVKDQEMDELLVVMAALGDDFESVRNHLLIEVFYLTGMRLSELIGLNDMDVDFEMLVVKVTGKRNKQRLIPIGEELKRDLAAYIQIRNEAVPEREDNAFFVRKNGKRMYPVLVRNLVKEYLSTVVVQCKKSPHVLRHTFATTMLNHGASLSVVKELLGHESLSTTEIYTHTTFEELKQVYNHAHPRA